MKRLSTKYEHTKHNTMKKLLTIFAVLLMAATNLKAQEGSAPIVPDLYTIGYKDNTSSSRTAMLYKNNALLHSISAADKQVTPYKITGDNEGNIYWMVVYSENGTNKQTEIWKNEELYVSTEGHNGISIKDLYCIGDTLFYAGNTTTEGGVKVATVWRGPDFTPHWVLGDGQHSSFINDADVDKSTNIPYFCGYTTDSLRKACVWKASQLFYKHAPAGVQRDSWANEISVDNGSVYTNGYVNYDTGEGIYSFPIVWKDNVQIYYATDYDFVNCLYANQEDFYFTFCYPHGMYFGVYKNGAELLRLPASIQRICGGFDDIYMVGKLNGQSCIWKNFDVLSQHDDCDMIMDLLAVEATEVDTTFAIDNSEWYYEILNDDGSITYQHLECVGDTLFNREGKRPKVIVRSNTHYDRNEETEVTHEYVYEENGIVYWWNKDLQEFTTLYNLNANAGDEWEIKVGLESLIVHVNAVENVEYEGHTYRMLHVSDAADVFSGNIVRSIGHLTSFFPERLMTRGKGYRVEGMRCYWVDGELVFKNGEQDCDEVYRQWHNGLVESEEIGFSVYPIPVKGQLRIQFAPNVQPKQIDLYDLQGRSAHAQSGSFENIDLSRLPAGVYTLRVTMEDGSVYSDKVVKE